MENKIKKESAIQNKIVRCVSLVAVSSKQQSERSSLDDQRKENLEFIENMSKYYPGHIGELVEELSLASTRKIIELGEAVEKYPNFYGRLVKMIKAREFDALVIRTRDRVGREESLIMTIEALCRVNNIVFVPIRSTLPQSLDPQVLKRNEGAALVAAIESGMARIETQRISDRVEKGCRERVVERKLFRAQIPYGYKYLRDENDDQYIVQDAEKAEVVRFIFEKYLEGWGSPKICIHLNAQGIKSPRGGKWGKNSAKPFLERVRLYAGYLDINRYSDDREHIVVKGNHEPIITEDEMHRVLKAKEHRKRVKTPVSRVFYGMTYCESCGRTLMTDVSDDGNKKYYYMRCRGRYKSDGYQACSKPTRISEVRIRASLLAAIENLKDGNYSHDDSIETNRERIAQEIATLKEKLDTLSNRRQTVIDLHIDRAITRDEMNQRLGDISIATTDIGSRIEQLETDLEGLGNKEERAKKLQEVAEEGVYYMQMIDHNPAAANVWLREHFRVYVKNGMGYKKKHLDYVSRVIII